MGKKQHEKDLPRDSDGEIDYWALVEPPKKGKDWHEKNGTEKADTVLMTFVKVTLLLGLLYMFICSLDFLSNAFRLLGGKAAGQVFTNNVVLSNPVANVMIGVLATVLLQSSSTTTSIVVSMVSSGILQVWPAIFMVMGANIGTSVTNTIVSMGHAVDRNEFRRAFAGATVHDMFNWLSVFCLFPIEWISGSIGSWKKCGILCQMTKAITEGLAVNRTAPYGDTKNDMLKVITKPFTSLIIQLDKNVITAIANNDSSAFNKSLVKHKCTVETEMPVVGIDNATGQCGILGWEMQETKERCVFVFEHISNYWPDWAIGIFLLVLSLLILCLCLACIVKLLHSVLQGKIAKLIKRFLNSDFPGCCKHVTGYVAILMGAGLTILVQSSSIFTSALTPLVGVGVLRLDRMYPLTLGANIGTTVTAILAALASDVEELQFTLQVALCHLFFNIFGILIWYPVPAMRNVPINLAKKLGNTTAKYRWFAPVYLFVMFFLFPAAIFGLSIAGWYVLLGVLVPSIILIIVIIIINKLQEKKPESLPEKLRSWDFLPKPLHSLEPYDKIFSACNIGCRKNCPCCGEEVAVEDGEAISDPPSYTSETKDPGALCEVAYDNGAYEKSITDQTAL